MGKVSANVKNNRATSLNEQQRKAIEHIYGPLLMVAGAGTGKTSVIVERVGYLLKHVSDLQPEQILALSFSRKAAAEMQQRALDQFGEHVRGCRFSTFHAFCYGLLAEQSAQRVMDEIDQWIFLRQHLEELELDYYLHVAEPGRFLNELVEFCSRCHDNLVSPGDYTGYVEQLVADCHHSRLKPLPKECSEEELARQQEVARVYTRSEALQEQEGLLSFGAMVSYAVALLDSSPNLLRRIQNQYRFLLVDEFQDTNPAQFELLVRLAGKHKNLAVVGDDNQAIYRFRGASYGSFKQFAEYFPEHTRIVLDQNYRSTQRILTVAGAAIAFNPNEDRYLPEKRLFPAKRDTDPGPGSSVEVWEFEDVVQQAEFVVAEIARRVGSGEVNAYSDFAVLYRAHRHRDLLVTALRREGVPFAIRNLAVNRLPPVRDLMAYLRAIGHPTDNISLARVIADPRWGVEIDLFFEYCQQARNQKKTLYEIIQEDSIAAKRAGAKELLAFLGRFAKIAEQQRVSAWLDLLREELGFSGDSDQEPAIQAFCDFIKQWDQEKSATGLLGEFLEYLGFFEEAGGAITLQEDDEKPFWVEADPPKRQAETSEPRQGILWEEVATNPLGKVQLMTIHGAKGLEFEHVIVFHLLRGAFPTRHRSPLITLPTPLWKGPLPEGDFHIEEERRLFYVALTRARSTLTLCTVSNDRQRPSVFLEELRQCPDLEWKRPPISTPELAGIAWQETSKLHSPGSQIADWTATPPAPLAEELTLSASGLETYLECPLKYQYSSVWRIPLSPSPAMLFGSILHGAVKELVHTLTQCPQEISPASIQSLLDRHWNSSGFSDPLQERKYREMGRQQLEGVWQVWSGRRLELLHQEKGFQLHWAGTRIIGRVDQIHRSERQRVELIEYKTGRPQTQKEADHSLQLTIYAKACRDILGLESTELILFNLATQECLPTTRNAQDFQKAQQKIQQTASRIRAREFPAQPGYHCRYCTFQPICPAHEDIGLSRGVVRNQEHNRTSSQNRTKELLSWRLKHRRMRTGGKFMNASDKRRARRFPMQLPVIVRVEETNEEKASTQTLNISSTGVYFQFGSEMDIGSPVEFILTLPEQITRGGAVQIKCIGKVVRVDRGNSAVGVAATIERYEFLRES
ncbi:MAG: UvrD-helicase domain-containing protein [Acidobacteria bacterium]|nr:UvrD-helicase domain-containing protein [Acidobacteriota bacterium]